jgi:putative acetyltransferase
MSTWAPETVTLRDDRTVTLRVCTPDDLPSMYELDREVVEDARGVVRTADDMPTLERFVAQHEGRVRRLDGGSAGVFLVAIDGDGRVVAEGHVGRPPVSLSAHSTVLALSVRPDHQGVGLGRALMEGLLRWARTATPPVERIGLFTLANNDRALALYESYGFEREGLRRRYIKLPDGTYVDDVVMALFL